MEWKQLDARKAKVGERQISVGEGRLFKGGKVDLQL